MIGLGLGRAARLERLVVQLAGVMTARSLYAPGHPSVDRALRSLVEAVVAVCDDRRQDSITFLVLDTDLVVDSLPFRRGGLHHQAIVRVLRRAGVERLTLGRGVDLAECARLADALAAGAPWVPSPNVVLGRVDIEAPTPEPGLREEGSRPRATWEAPSREDPHVLTALHIEHAKEAFARFRVEGAAAVSRFDELVWVFVDTLSRSTRSMLPAVPLKSHDEYTFVHSVNVALLVMAQARSFGFEESAVHAVGLAALLHDVGKLTIPLSILNKPGRLEAEEWRIMTSHAELGAWHLSQLERSAPLSILVAYEHHLRFDGKANYPLLRFPRPPNLASQLTAIADVYDAICTARPYRRARARSAALDALRNRAGTFHDPLLVGNFCRLVEEGPPVEPVAS